MLSSERDRKDAKWRAKTEVKILACRDAGPFHASAERPIDLSDEARGDSRQGLSIRAESLETLESNYAHLCRVTTFKGLPFFL
jgi:hypothetical protein